MSTLADIHTERHKGSHTETHRDVCRDMEGNIQKISQCLTIVLVRLVRVRVRIR